MAMLLRKLGITNLSDRGTGSPKGSRKAAKQERSVLDRRKAQDSVKVENTAKDVLVPTSAREPSLQQHRVQVRAKRLMKELQEIHKTVGDFMTVELVGDNLFEWTVKLYQIDHDSLLWKDMRETNTEFILVGLSFPENFPFSPPFVRVLDPVIENGYVLDGGAICMELLTPRGWSSAYTVEAIMRQFSASLVKGQGRICRKTGKSRKAFTRKEAEASFRNLMKTHEKYGWVTPPSMDG
ncbi:ubiquitin-conjugating enzyme E2Q-like protein 1 [Protopterus annectens]|uniref:ubiquitin-conjugating enzyme E2Q-like protein 1 n=1 Tax=Protopterus annectens TaxID=7888 RepID=UPI001CFC43B6|nr:ubiquitin-conjugating enzyme E2Q-like protein 1 [Protopterus annectens]